MIIVTGGAGFIGSNLAKGLNDAGEDNLLIVDNLKNASKHLNLKADPKVISGRARYLLVRLAFHHYPQVIRAFFNIQRFGPSRNVTFASPCPWIDH